MVPFSDYSLPLCKTAPCKGCPRTLVTYTHFMAFVCSVSIPAVKKNKKAWQMQFIFDVEKPSISDEFITVK